MNSSTGTSNHTMIYTLLVVLAISTVGITFLHLPLVTHNTLLFTIAFVMAALVAVQYMNLKVEGALIYWLVGVPFLLFAILVFTLIPEFVWHHTILVHPAASGH